MGLVSLTSNDLPVYMRLSEGVQKKAVAMIGETLKAGYGGTAVIDACYGVLINRSADAFMAFWALCDVEGKGSLDFEQFERALILMGETFLSDDELLRVFARVKRVGRVWMGEFLELVEEIMEYAYG
jgi:hypothetical protein